MKASTMLPKTRSLRFTWHIYGIWLARETRIRHRSRNLAAVSPGARLSHHDCSSQGFQVRPRSKICGQDCCTCRQRKPSFVRPNSSQLFQCESKPYKPATDRDSSRCTAAIFLQVQNRCSNHCFLVIRISVSGFCLLDSPRSPTSFYIVLFSTK